MVNIWKDRENGNNARVSPAMNVLPTAWSFLLRGGKVSSALSILYLSPTVRPTWTSSFASACKLTSNVGPIVKTLDNRKEH